MRFSEKWLRQWVNPAISSEELAAQLTMAGLEVDAVEPAAPPFNNIVIGEVLSVTPHPQADKLNLTKVNVGTGEPLDIVCGAKNVAPGIKVPTAMVGAELPGGMKIKKAKLRGEPSHGMLCSAAELGMADSAEGLMILADDAPVGKDVREYFELDDTIIEIDLTPNRGDCASVRGVAREVAVNNGLAFQEMDVKSVVPAIDDTFPVRVDAAADCPRYLGRVIRHINPQAETPLWMREVLRRSGLRSLGPAVDVTNYVLLELGQPLHAFDLDKLSGSIVVRHAKAGERIKLLDDSEVKLDNDVLVIADEKQAHAFAGVMGGDDSAVSDSTQHVFLECAYFDPDLIRGKGRRYGKQTDSSYRFERGVDFQLQQRAIERATALLVEIAGGQPGPVTEVSNKDKLPELPTIIFRPQRANAILGLDITEERMATMLTALGCTLEQGGDTWQVVPASHRFDLRIEADLVEEVCRVNGYDQIGETLPVKSMIVARQSEAQLLPNKIRQLLIDRGYCEAITYSFVDEATQQLLEPDQALMTLANPISAEMSVMRTTLWSSLIKALAHNQARQQSRVRLFELGKVFRQRNGKLEQHSKIGAVVTGNTWPIHWQGVKKVADFFDVKGDIESILALTRAPGDFIFNKGEHPALHPGQTARIERQGELVGWIGTLHPNLRKKLDVSGEIILFELDYEGIKDGLVPAFAPISRFPSITRDLALVVDDEIDAEKILGNVRQTSGQLLKNLTIFDIYKGKGVPDGKKSLAISLTIQDDRETLTDDAVDTLIAKIVKELQTTTGAMLRE